MRLRGRLGAFVLGRGWIGLASGAPANVTAPVIAGSAVVQQVLYLIDVGTWTNAPMSFTYQWQRDGHGSLTYANIPFATATTYTLVDDDDQCNIRCVVTAYNSIGSGSANSNVLGLVIEPLPVEIGEPYIEGTPNPGNRITVTDGVWLHMGGYHPSFTYQWQRSADGVTGWGDLAGKHNNYYDVVRGDLGYYFRVQITAHNSGGTTTVVSDTVGPAIELGFICQFSTADPGDVTQVWHDITPYVLTYSISRGKQRILDRFEAGTMQLRLKNTDRRFDPANTAGPYYPSLRPMRQIRFGFVVNGATSWAFTGNIAQWPQIWQGPTWAEIDLSCVDAFEVLAQSSISSAYPSLTTTLGSNRDLKFTSTVLGFVGNQTSITYDGIFTKAVHSAGERPLSVSVTGTNITITLAINSSGSAVTSANAIMQAVNSDPIANQLVLVSLAPGSNGTGIISTSMPQTFLSGSPFDLELTGSRITQILNAINWSATARVISTGDKYVQAEVFAPSDQIKALDQCYDTSDSEMGAFFVDADGNITFLDLDALVAGVYSTTQVTFLDQNANDKLSQVNYTNVNGIYDRDLIYNDIRVTRLNGQEQVASDATSQTRYLLRTLTANPIVISDNEALGMAEALLYRFKEPQVRFDSIRVWPGEDTSAWSTLVNLDLMMAATVKRTPPGGGQPIVVNGSIINIQIEGGPGPVHNTAWTFQVDKQVTQPNSFIFNSSTYGKFGSGTFGY